MNVTAAPNGKSSPLKLGPERFLARRSFTEILCVAMLAKDSRNAWPVRDRKPRFDQTGSRPAFYQLVSAFGYRIRMMRPRLTILTIDLQRFAGVVDLRGHATIQQ